MENRSGLVVETAVTEANGMAERQAAQAMIVRHSPGARRLRLGADKGYDAKAFVADLRFSPLERIPIQPNRDAL